MSMIRYLPISSKFLNILNSLKKRKKMQPKDGKNVACLAEMRKGTLSVCTAAALFVPLNLHMYFYMYLLFIVYSYRCAFQ